ncbi:MAG: beta-propeller domain-containing protein [Vallitaleaceae bacterium]|jgi:inhibitor of cysteine peptidase|nr:beta-propeller domain-containing protein [Vallitaleaceae bacterium]
MRSKIISGLLVLIMLLQPTTVAAGNDPTIKISIDGQIISLEEEVYTSNSRVLVPLRSVFEYMGILVDYNETTRQVIAKSDDIEVVMDIGEDLVLVNGQITRLDVGTLALSGRTYVPIKFIAEAFGNFVDWDAQTRTVIIKTNGGMPFANEKLPVVSSREALTSLLQYNEKLTNYIYGGLSNEPMLEMDVAPTSDSVAESPEAISSSDNGYSDTNNQVAGVQESDVIKTDGEYIYQVVDGKVNIYSAVPDQVSLINTISPSDFTVTEVFMVDHQLILYGQKFYGYLEPYLIDGVTIDSETTTVEPVTVDAPMVESMILPYYGEDEVFMSVYDVTSPSNPLLNQAYKFDGNYISGRVIGDYLYLATDKYFWPGPLYEAQSSSSYTDAELLPSYTNILTGETTTLDYSDIRYFPDNVSSNYFMTIGLSLKSGEIDVDAYLGYGGQVYVSETGFYTAVTHYEYNILESATELYRPAYDVNTAIYKFDIGEGKMSYDAKGMVNGTILNQFSMDEYDGNFRVATTKGNNWWWGTNNESTNNLYVLDGGLNQIGAIEGLAKGETIYSTRFVGDKIYMVTFRQVDPFFVIDASVPSNPVVQGYLKIPGFSSYMHPMDETHILGFGQETVEDASGRVTTAGFKISLFDVTDFENPIESDKLVIGLSGTNSELEYNHKALMYAIEKNLMAIPISVCETIKYNPDVFGAYVFNISTSDISIAGRVTHHEAGVTIEKDNYSDYVYFDWDYNISRTLYIGDYLYTFSNKLIVVYDLDSLDEASRLSIK